MGIAENLNQVWAHIAAAALAAGRDPATVRLIAVSKTNPIERIQEAFTAGQILFGENRVQELQEKQILLPQAQWHLIGHLQTNKVKYIAPYVAMIHSVDSERLLAEIHTRAAQNGRKIPVLLQVNISEEDQKSGMAPEAVQGILQLAHRYPNSEIVGLMGLAAFTDDAALIRGQFQTLAQLLTLNKATDYGPSVDLHELSMGMSGDYAIAIAQGATLVRIGSAVFGAR
jgi:PLP dependent protein